MARHRSPQGRRAHLGLPLSLSPAAAGAGGGAVPFDTRSLPVRFVATAVAGSALAAAGQYALSEALPAATDGTNLLRVGAAALLAPQDAAAAAAVPVVAQPVIALAPVAPSVAELPASASAADLVKAADLQRAAAEEAARLVAEAARAAEEAAAEAARAAEEAAAEAARAVEEAAAGAAREVGEAARAAEPAVATASGGVQMVVGRITSGFGARGGRAHEGLDIAAPIGTPIRVPLGGTVTDSGPASGYGQWVRVRHDDGTVTVYGHISRSHVRVGESVSAGEVIADVGNEGRSTGPHLHFEVVTSKGTNINPRPWLDERGVKLT